MSEQVRSRVIIDGAADSVNLWFFFDHGEDGFLTLNVPEAAVAIYR